MKCCSLNFLPFYLSSIFKGPGGARYDYFFNSLSILIDLIWVLSIRNINSTLIFQPQEQYDIAEMKHADNDSNIIAARYSRRPHRVSRNVSENNGNCVDETSRKIASNNPESNDSQKRVLVAGSTSENQTRNTPDTNAGNIYYDKKTFQ